MRQLNGVKLTWGQRIDIAEKNGLKGFDLEDEQDAGSWPDCACGEQDPRIPRYHEGVPRDRLLTVLGSRFHLAVKFDDFSEARWSLARIEARAAELILEQADR